MKIECKKQVTFSGVLKIESAFNTFVLESLHKYLSHNAYITIDVFYVAIIDIYTLLCPTQKNKLAT